MRCVRSDGKHPKLRKKMGLDHNKLNHLKLTKMMGRGHNDRNHLKLKE